MATKIKEFVLLNDVKVQYAIETTNGENYKDEEDEDKKDRMCEAILVEYDRLGGAITRDSGETEEIEIQTIKKGKRHKETQTRKIIDKIETGSFYDFKRKCAVANPELKVAKKRVPHAEDKPKPNMKTVKLGDRKK